MDQQNTRESAHSPYTTSTNVVSSKEDLLKQLSDIKFALDQSVIVSVTDKDGIIQYVNDKFCEITKYSSEELIGKPYSIVNSGYHPKSFFTQLWQCISQGMVWSGEVCNRAKDDSLFWLMTTIVPFLDKDGAPFQYITVRTDITDRKHAEERIQSINEELEEKVVQRTAHLDVLNKELSATVAYYTHLKQQILALLSQNETQKPENFEEFKIPAVLMGQLSNKKGAWDYGLSERELDVLNLIVSGKTNKEIAESLTITVHTVKSHVSNIIQKLDVTDRTQAAIKALRFGLVSQ